jgi:polyhydroxyalkanoate synthase
MKVDRSAFKVGKDLAATPGKVIYRNDLIEVIQYSPQTEQVHEVPMLVSPPWINKYYIMDLAPNRSLFEWTIKQGRTLFVMSYRNPDQSMGHYTLDNYLYEGPMTGFDIVQEVTGAPKIDVFSLCLGGAMASMTAAYMAKKGDDRLGCLTLSNCLLDYSKPGELGTMVDPQTLKTLEKKMKKTGLLDGADMAGTFDMLRANDLIFNYVVSRWLQGEPPSAFDILAWNEDSTRMPAAMHTTYIRTLYQENRLAKGTMELGGEILDLSLVDNDVYVVGAVNDHIVPWESSYESTHLFGGDVRYVLSSGGHIAGVVNPPTPKAWYEADETGGKAPADPAEWRAKATRHSNSWWEDWTRWTTDRAGAMIDPPEMGGSKYKPIADAPGTYVFG